MVTEHVRDLGDIVSILENENLEPEQKHKVLVREGRSFLEVLTLVRDSAFNLMEEIGLGNIIDVLFDLGIPLINSSPDYRHSVLDLLLKDAQEAQKSAVADFKYAQKYSPTGTHYEQYVKQAQFSLDRANRDVIRSMNILDAVQSYKNLNLFNLGFIRSRLSSLQHNYQAILNGVEPMRKEVQIYEIGESISGLLKAITTNIGMVNGRIQQIKPKDDYSP